MDIHPRRRSSSPPPPQPEPEPEPEPDSSSATLLGHEPSLIGHVSQPLIDRYDNYSPRSLAHYQSPEPLPLHPFSLNFPTLNTDGSVEDLTSHESRRYPTPPASLSALGARSTMASREDASESESSCSDSQFEMISHDELSEVSSDDHDTASIASNDDGLTTPEYVGSDDEQEQDHSAALGAMLVAGTVAQNDVGSRYNPPGTAASFVRFPSTFSAGGGSRLQQMKAGNDLVDSYDSEDLETPRQSTLPSSLPDPYCTTSGQPSRPNDDTKHILFLSIRHDSEDISRQDIDLICSRVASCMHTVKDATSDIIPLPLMPSGTSPELATVACGQDTASVTIQHCIGAERRAFGSYGLRILDNDGKHSSTYTVGGNRKIELPQPDLAIIYIDQPPSMSGEMAVAYQAVRSMKVPIILIYEANVSGLPKIFNKAKRYEQLTIEAGRFLELDRASLKPMIRRLIDGNTSVKSKKRGASKAALLRVMLVGLIALLYLNIAWPISGWNSSTDIPIRREALIASLEKATTSINVTQDINIEHLIPSLPSTCYSARQTALPTGCEQGTRLQGIKPNHVVLSLPGKRHFPNAVATEVFKQDGRLIDFKQSKLIEGIYLLTIDPVEAYGNVNVKMLTKDPLMNVTGTHNFGRQLFKSYEKASTDVSKVVSKDVAVIRHAARILSDKLSTEIGEGVWAAKNVTTQLAVYVARELQVFSGTAATLFCKAAKASNLAATSRKDIVRYTKKLTVSVQSQVESAKSSSKALIHSRLSLSRQRVADFRKALQRKRDSRMEGKPVSGAIFKKATAPPIDPKEDLADYNQHGH